MTVAGVIMNVPFAQPSYLSKQVTLFSPLAYSCVWCPVPTQERAGPAQPSKNDDCRTFTGAIFTCLCTIVCAA